MRKEIESYIIEWNEEECPVRWVNINGILYNLQKLTFISIDYTGDEDEKYCRVIFESERHKYVVAVVLHRESWIAYEIKNLIKKILLYGGPQ